MPNRSFPAALAATALLLGALPAGAEGRYCAAHDDVVQRLTTEFGETLQSIGLAGRDAMVEVFDAPETGSWTIIVTTPTGRSCLIASGQAFENLAEHLPDGSRGA